MASNRTTLWRVAKTEDPWFGRGSYWATTRAFALTVGRVFDMYGLAARALFTVDVEMDPAKVLDLRRNGASPRLISSGIIEEVVAKHEAALGRTFDWAMFYESPLFPGSDLDTQVI